MNQQHACARATCPIVSAMAWCAITVASGCKQDAQTASAPATLDERPTPSQVFPRAEADKLVKLILAEAAKAKPSEWYIAEMLNDLGAALYADYDDLAQAETLLKRATAIWKETKSPGHIFVGIGLNNLGRLCHAQARHERAGILYREALAILEETAGPNDPRTAACLNNLARLYHEQGKYDEAQRRYERALGIHEAGLGLDDQGLAVVLQNSAAFYKAAGNAAKGDELEIQANVARRRCGPPDPLMARVATRLASFYINHMRYDEAEPLLKEALRIREQVLGADHLYVAASLNNLALMYLECPGVNQAAKGEPLFQQELESIGLVPGASANQAAKGEPLCKRALAIYEKNLDPDHPYVIMTQNNLAWLYSRQGKRDLAKPLFDRVAQQSRHPTRREEAALPDDFPVMLMATGKPVAAKN